MPSALASESRYTWHATEYFKKFVAPQHWAVSNGKWVSRRLPLPIYRNSIIFLNYCPSSKCFIVPESCLAHHLNQTGDLMEASQRNGSSRKAGVLSLVHALAIWLTGIFYYSAGQVNELRALGSFCEWILAEEAAAICSNPSQCLKTGILNFGAFVWNIKTACLSWVFQEDEEGTELWSV